MMLHVMAVCAGNVWRKLTLHICCTNTFINMSVYDQCGLRLLSDIR